MNCAALKKPGHESCFRADTGEADMEQAFALQVTTNARGPVVRLAGELDVAAAPAFQECLRELCAELATLDFSDVTFMDSTTIGVLLDANRRAQIDGGEFLLHGVQPTQRRTLDLMGVSSLFKFDSEP